MEQHKNLTQLKPLSTQHVQLYNETEWGAKVTIPEHTCSSISTVTEKCFWLRRVYASRVFEFLQV